MRLGIDIREACKERLTGKGYWTKCFVEELCTRNIDLVLFTDAPVPASISAKIDSHRVAIVTVPRSGFIWHWSVASRLRRDSSIDAYVSTVSYIVPFLLGRAKRTIPVVHDLIAFRGEPHQKRATRIERVTLGRAVKHAWFICSISDATKKDLLDRFTLLPQGNVVSIFAAPAIRIANDVHPDGETILCIGTLCPRKNQRRLIDAFAALPDDVRRRHRLILVGSRGWSDDDIVQAATTTDGVEWRSYLSIEECVQLMETATVFAFPSHYEGFGLPVLEAMAAGVPVLTSDRGSLKEIAGDAAYTINPDDTNSIRDGLLAMLTNEALRKDLIAKGRIRAEHYSWKRTADLFLSALNR